MKRIIVVTISALLLSTSPLLAQDAVIVEVPQTTRDYVVAHPTDPVVLEEDLTMGTVVSEDIELVPIPDTPEYSYVYVDKKPIIVSTKDRKVVYVAE
ncbi:DUF1236 domain-containing protein [Phyllobacterium sp. K27]